MISFSADPNAAEQEMRAVIYYLTAFGFVDGTFDVSEMGFVLRFVRELVEARARDARGITEAVRAELVDRWSRHFEEVAEEVAREIDAHTKEPVAEGEADGAFVMTRVKLRCFELFTRFDEESRARLLAIAEQMIAADGVVHPEELRFRDELHALLDAPQQLDDAEVEVALEEVNAKVSIHAPARRPVLHDGHEFLTHGEWDYPSDPEGFAREADRDVHLAERLIKRLDAARARGAGRLQGAGTFAISPRAKAFSTATCTCSLRRRAARWSCWSSATCTAVTPASRARCCRPTSSARSSATCKTRRGTPR